MQVFSCETYVNILKNICSSVLLVLFLSVACTLDLRVTELSESSDQPPKVEVSPLYGSLGLQWNDYIKDDGPTPYTASGTPCDPYADSSCLHAGPLRHVNTKHSSCSGLSLSDSIGVFSWQCKDTSGEAVFFVSNPNDINLNSLIDANGWIEIQIELKKNGQLIAQSEPSAWWDNPIVSLPDNSATSVITLDDVDDDGPGPDAAFSEGTIFYLQNTRSSPGYNINVDKTAFLIAAGETLTYSGSGSNNCTQANGEVTGADRRCLLASGKHNFLWIEGGSFDGKSAGGFDADHSLLLNGVRFSEVRNITVSGAVEDGLRISYADTTAANNLAAHNTFQSILTESNTLNGLYLESTNSLYSHVLARDNGQHGVFIAPEGVSNHVKELTSIRNFVTGMRILGHGNLLQKLHTGFNGSSGVFFSDGASNNSAVDVKTHNNGSTGLIIHLSATSNVVTKLFTAHNDTMGVLVESTSTFNTISHVTAILNYTYGTYLHGDNNTINQVLAMKGAFISIRNYSGSGNLYSHIAFVNAQNQGIAAGGGVTFSGVIFAGFSHNFNCAVTGTSNLSDAGGVCQPGAGYTLIDNLATLENSTGGLISNDSKNADTVNLSGGTLQHDSITDILHFEDRFRLWGKATSTAPFDDSNRGACLTGVDCAIWDYRPLTSDTTILGFHGNFVNGAPCPSSVNDPGAELTDTSGRTFLRSAVEVLADNIGNDNGLCEANETCIYSPNFGYYQGEGNYTPQTCVYTGTAVPNVTLHAFPNNGI